MPLKDRLDDVARHELDAERRRHLAALAEADEDPHAFLREFETHLSRVTDIMQRLHRRALSSTAQNVAAKHVAAENVDVVNVADVDEDERTSA